MPEDKPTRICKKCSTPKSVDLFARNKQGGPTWECKTCEGIRKQAWADANRDRVRLHKKAYEDLYPERVVASKADNRIRKGVEYNRRSVERKQADPEATRAKYRAQYAKDPTPFIVRNKRREERDAIVGGIFTISDKSALFESQGGLCANPQCRTDLSESGFHADHILPVVRGGSHNPENRQLLCPTCNHRKGTMTNEEWFAKQELRTA